MQDKRDDELFLRLVKEINEIKSSLRRTVATLPLFDIANENTPATLKASQNDYAIGNYDVLRISSSLAVSITGFAGGVKGRYLRLFNVGSYAITLSYNSGSSVSANRIYTSTGSSVSIGANGWATLYYDSTISKWRLAGNS